MKKMYSYGRMSSSVTVSSPVSAEPPVVVVTESAATTVNPVPATVVADVADTVATVATVATVTSNPTVPADLQLLLQILTDMLQKKPQNQAEFTNLYHQVTVQLSGYLVKQLPAAEQKAALLALWAVEQVETASVGCFGKK
jgi:hypothetical protein